MSIPDVDPTAIELDTKGSTDPFVRRMYGITAHGHLPIDVPFISEIHDGLYQGGCERGMVLPEKIKNLVSLYPWERYTVEHELRVEEYVTMYDSTTQGFEQVEKLADLVVEAWKIGPTLVHCQAGLNRSGLIAARALMLATDCTADFAISLMRERRSPAVLCNPSFEAHLRSFDEDA